MVGGLHHSTSYPCLRINNLCLFMLLRCGEGLCWSQEPHILHHLPEWAPGVRIMGWVSSLTLHCLHQPCVNLHVHVCVCVCGSVLCVCSNMKVWNWSNQSEVSSMKAHDPAVWAISGLHQFDGSDRVLSGRTQQYSGTSIKRTLINGHLLITDMSSCNKL